MAIKKSILLVDDDELLGASLKAGLERKGYEVRVAGNGRIGLTMIDEQKPDVVVLDLFMPEMEGVETLRLLKKKHADLPVYAITGGGRKELYELLSLAEGLGAVGSLRKPFTASDLIALIETPR